MTSAAPTLRHELHYGDRVLACFTERPTDLDRMLRRAVARAPQRTALVAGARRITYAEVDSLVDAVAANLAASGLVAGDRIGLLAGNRIEFVLVMFGAIRAGLVVVPLGTRLAMPEIAYALGQCEATALVVEAACAGNVPPATVITSVRHTFVVGDLGGLVGDLMGAAPHLAGAVDEGRRWRPFSDLVAPPVASAATPVLPPHPIAEEDVFCLLYTSGTTGRPKGAKLTHLGAVHSVLTYSRLMALTDGEVSVLAVPASHVTGVVAVLATVVNVAGTVVLMESFKARAFLELAAAERMTHTLLVPAMYNLCLLDPHVATFDLSAWHIGGFGGAAMPEATITRLATLLPRLGLVNAYGSTETTSPIVLMPPDELAGREDSVGRAVPGARLLVMDDDGREALAGTIGEIWAAGPMVVPGYWADPQADRTGFAGGYWKSGDLGSIDADGYVRVLDRKKDMINRGGYKVYSLEVENALAAHAGIVESAVVGRPDAVLGERTHAFVVRRDTALTAGDVAAFARTRVADYKVPDGVTILDEPLPRNANGKVMKGMLKARLG